MHALARAGKHQAVPGQHQNQNQQSAHHPLGNTLQAALQPKAAHHKAHDHRDGHPEGHFGGRAQQTSKHARHRIGAHSRLEGAGGKFHQIAQHPAGHRGVIHHQQAAADHAEIAVDMPLAALRLQRLVAVHRTAAAGAAHGQLHREHRHAHAQQKQQIQDHKQAAAALARHIGETPHIANADGAARTYQQKSHSGLK